MPEDSQQCELNAVPHLKPARLDVLKALIGLLALDIIVKVKGFPSLHRIVKRWPVSEKANAGQTLDQICQAVEKACAYYFKSTLCLQRSAITTCLLRNHGVPAEMVIGCKIMPYHGHAWVEVAGKVVNDRPSVQQVYSVLERM